MPKTTRRSRRTRRSKTLVSRRTPRPTQAEVAGEAMVKGTSVNAATAVSYSKMLGEPDLAAAIEILDAESRAVSAGDLSGLEAMLVAQATTLNAMFTQLAYHASQITSMDQIDRVTRLALKAQAQCRTTVQTLAFMQHPPAAVFARQANIAHGPQQVNNAGPGTPLALASGDAAPTGQNELLEEPHGEWMDPRAPQAPSRCDPVLATVGAIKRPMHS